MRFFTSVFLASVIVIMGLACGDDDSGSDPNTAAGSDGGASGKGAAEAGRSGSSGQSGGVATAGRSSAGATASGAAGKAGNAAGAGAAGASGMLAPELDAGLDDDAGLPGEPEVQSGELVALTYNVAGLPEGFSQSMPLTYTPLIAPLLNNYDLVFLQESWQTPVPNPVAPLRVYHEILVAGSTHPYKTVPAEQPLGNDPSRPTALLGDGINIFSEFALGDTTRVAWTTCVDTASDCLAFKGFSMTPAQLTDGSTVHFYDLHMEAGSSAADDMARDMGIDQLIAFMAANSEGQALIVGGDFNLATDTEPAKSQLARLLQTAGLTDSCTALMCPRPGNIDKLLYRSSDRIKLEAKSWHLESEVFVSADGMPLSDHEPLAVRFSYQVER
jgi:endonuclease/exonuclease/phosphatase family metal-dependent hydrolase